MKKFAANFIRFAISFGVLGGLVYLIGLDRIIENFRSVSPIYLLLAIGIFFVILLLMALRWQLLLNSQQHSPGYWRLLMFYFIGYFLNNFLPTAIGGDVGRAYYVGKANNNMALSVGSVFFERILGVLATMTLAGISMLWLAGNIDPRLLYSTLIVLFASLTGVAILLIPALYNFTTSVIGKISVWGIGEKINRVLESVHFYRNAKKSRARRIFVVCGISTVVCVDEFRFGKIVGTGKCDVFTIVTGYTDNICDGYVAVRKRAWCERIRLCIVAQQRFSFCNR